MSPTDLLSTLKTWKNKIKFPTRKVRGIIQSTGLHQTQILVWFTKRRLQIKF